MPITAKDVSDFYNSTFFDENGKLLQKRMDVVLIDRDQEKSLVMPDVLVDPNIPLHLLIRLFHNFVKKHGEIPDPDEIEDGNQTSLEEVELKEKIIDFERMEYRGKFYFLEVGENDEIKIFNEARDKEISLKSAVGKSLVKQYNDNKT